MEDEFEDFYYLAQDGLRLHARIYGRDHHREALPVICLAGLTRNARDFHDLALYLTRNGRPRMVVAFDYRGRGLSQYDRDWRHYDVLVEASDIVAGMIALDIEHAAFIGNSRGGMIIHVLAATRPAALKAVVLNDIGPVLQGEGVAQIRTFHRRAPKPRSWNEAIDILKMASETAFPALEASDWERMARAAYRENARGRIVPDFDRALIKTLHSVDISKPLPEAWPQFMGLRKVPMMVIRGENSNILASETLEAMQLVHSKLEAVIVPGQGHAPVLETGDLPGRISRFIGFSEG